ncbi:MAG: antibiotic biosynthesis monooxygenase, partial [Arenicellales bacterium]
YALMADKMAALSAEQTGFLGMTHATTDEGESVTTCYWQDEAAILNWKHHPEHQAAQEKGLAKWYDEYQIEIAEIKRAYRWSR